MATADVTVLGAGVIGLSCALACLRQGAKVDVVDPNGPASGASGGIVGALAPHTPDNWNPKKQFQFESLLMARDFWPWVEKISGQDTGYSPTGRLQPILTEKQIALAQNRALSAKTYWKNHAIWNVVEPTGQDWEPYSPTGLFIHDTLSAHIHPKQATLAMATAFRALGGQFSENCTGVIIDATGWHGLKSLSQSLNKDIGNGVKGQAALLDANFAGKQQIFADTLHFIPHTNGTVAVGSTSERDFADPTSTDAQIEDIIEKAKKIMPVLNGAKVIDRWAHVRPRAKSRAPMMGPHPLKTDHYIANGGFKIGFGMAPKIGTVMADLVLNQRDTIPDEFHVNANL